VELLHPASPAAHVVIQRLDVVNLILNPVMFADYQALMNDACSLFGYLDVALVAICAENRAPTKRNSSPGLR
jgi:hypothetical protein